MSGLLIAWHPILEVVLQPSCFSISGNLVQKIPTNGGDKDDEIQTSKRTEIIQYS